MINKTIGIIEAEEADDVEKKETCIEEQKTYEEHAGKDSGGGNLERLEGLSVEELEKACSEKPECVGFNSAGWLKSTLAESDQWYDWEEGTLYVKMLNGVP